MQESPSDNTLKSQQMTKEQILIEGLKPYLEDPSRRSVLDGDCVYNGPNETHCFVGQFMPDELKKLGKNMPENRSEISILLDYHKDIFVNHPIINEDNLEFLDECQILHDTNSHWTDKTISKQGILYLKHIISAFGLDEEQISSQLNLEL